MTRAGETPDGAQEQSSKPVSGLWPIWRQYALLALAGAVLNVVCAVAYDRGVERGYRMWLATDEQFHASVLIEIAKLDQKLEDLKRRRDAWESLTGSTAKRPVAGTEKPDSTR